MRTNIQVPNYDSLTSTLLNAIRADAPQEYKDRIPSATQDNLDKVLTSIKNFEYTRNYYVDALLNKIAFTEISNASFENNFKRFKMPSYENGTDIEHLFVDLIKAQVYDADGGAATLFKRYLPTILSTYYTVNRQDMYPVTIEEQTLTLGFTNNNQGLTMISAILQALQTSDEYDEYLIVKNLLTGAIVSGALNVEVVAPVVDEASAKAFIKKVKTISGKYRFMSPDYNAARVRTACPVNRQVVIMTPETKAAIDVDALAASFNMNKVEFESDMELIDSFPDSKIIAMLVDEKWFRMRDRLREMRTESNGSTLSYNTFQHIWQSMHVSPFNNATVFLSDTPVLTSLTMVPSTATVQKQSFTQFHVEPVGTSFPPATATWTVNGASASTTVTSIGLLYVASDETTSPLTVTATSTYDTNITATSTVTVL